MRFTQRIFKTKSDGGLWSPLRSLSIIIILFPFSIQLKAQCVQQVWFDDFNDLSKWDYAIGNGCGEPSGCGFGNGELQTYTNSASNVSVANSKLTITATYANGIYSSGKLITKNKLNSSFTYGKIEASMKLSSAGGAWPAFWMLPQNGNWPITGEIDIMEAKHKSPTVEMGTIHYNYGAHQYTGGQITTTDLSLAFHTYGIEWQKDKITWFLDGVAFFTATPASTVGGAWPFNDTTNPFYMILNLAVGGPGTPFTGSVEATPADYPTTLQVDWVRVSTGIWNVAVTGNNYVYQNSTNNAYNVTPVSGATYNWSVPAGATITSGQGTTTINVNWGTASGDVTANVTTSCGTTAYKQAVIAEAPFTVDKILEDFQTNRNVTLKSSTGTFVNGTANPSVVAPNTSATVGKYTRNASEQYDVLAYSNVDVGNANDFVSRKRRIHIDIYTAAPVGTKITLQLENSTSALSTNFPTGRHSVYEATVVKQNAWQTLEFTYVSSPDPNVGIFGVDQLVFLYNSNSFTADTYYFDNLLTGRSGTIATGTLANTLLDYDANNSLVYKSSTGVYGGKVTNPNLVAPNTSANVGKYTRSASDLYDVLFFTGPVGDAGLFKDETDYFTIDVYTSAPIGTVISLQLENSAQSLTTNYPTGRNSVYQTKTMKTNAWETVRFYYSSSPDGALSNLAIDQVVILANPNSSTNHLYYFDNLKVYTTDPNRSVPFATETIIEDYQTNRRITYASSSGAYVNGQASPGGTNTTTVGKYTRSATDLYDVLTYNTTAITDAAPFKSRSKKFALDLYTSAPVGTVISFQLETAASVPSNYPTGRNSIYQAVTTKQNQWETLSFSYSSTPDGGAANSAISKIVMLFKPNSSTSDVYYIDNIRTLAQSVVADTQAPTVPANLASPSKTATSVDLTWTASTDNSGTVAGYEVFVNAEATPRVTVTSTAATISGLTSGTAYSFAVRAKDAALNYSTLSTALNVTTNVAVTGITISPATTSLVAGATQQLTATVAPANASNKTVSWSSGNTAVATVSNSGLVTSITAGTVVITVTTQDGAKTATSTITVTNATVAVSGVTVSPVTASLVAGGTQQLTATVAPANATNKTVSWSSGNAAVATVSSSGLVTSIAAGTAVITVTTQDGAKTATSTITVTVATVAVTGVAVSPTTTSITVGATLVLTATVAPANATNKTVIWSSNATAVATVNASGVVTAVTVGTATITVTTQDGTKTATSVITVMAAGINLALNKPTVTSSTENGTFSGSLAVDGNTTTSRWSSAFADPQWIYVDLGASYSVNRVKITWEAAYASAYKIQLSNDASTWSDLKVVTGNATAVNDNTSLSGTGRYVRIYGTTRATPYGYSIYELEVYGTPASTGVCSGTVANGDYSYNVTTTSGNVNWTFIPLSPIAGSTLCILYVKVGTGGYAGYIMNTSGSNFIYSVPFVNGQALTFYFTYRIGATTNERNSSATPHSYTSGATCTGGRVITTESEMNNENSYTVYPNPVDHTLTIRGATGGSLHIINLQGAEVSSGFMPSDEREVSHLNPGVYTVILFKENKRVVRRFIKK